MQPLPPESPEPDSRQRGTSGPCSQEANVQEKGKVLIKRNTNISNWAESPVASAVSTARAHATTCVHGDQVTCPSSTMGTAMTSHWLPALARYPGMPGEGTWVSLGAVTKSPSIPGDAAVWKTEGVGPNSPSDCGLGVTMGQQLPQALPAIFLLSHGSPN